MDSFREGLSGQRACTISGMHIEVAAEGQLKIGGRAMTPDEAEGVADVIRQMAAHARRMQQQAHAVAPGLRT